MIKCEICAESAWQNHYSGEIRDGKDGTAHGDIKRCGNCGAVRLFSHFKTIDYYKGKAYRESLKQDITELRALHFRENLQSAALIPKTGNVIVDLGAGAGGVLALIDWQRKIAVEPCKAIELEFERYCSAAEITDKSADLVTSFVTIEHVENPLELMRDAARISKRDILITTPELVDSPKFYRTHHNWYFDDQSLLNCAQRAGLKARIRRAHGNLVLEARPTD